MDSQHGLSVINRCTLCRLRAEGFFCSLSKTSIAAFERVKLTFCYPADAMVFLEGQHPTGIFLLCQGQAKLLATQRDGRTMILKIAKPGEVLGLHAAVTGRPYELTAVTMSPCQMNFVRREDFLKFLENHRDASLGAAQHVSHNCRSAYQLVRAIGLQNPVSGRMARLFLEWSAHTLPRNGTVRVNVGLTHEEISQLVGSTRETITRTLSDMKKNGVAELRRATLIIRNKAELERLAASDV